MDPLPCANLLASPASRVYSQACLYHSSSRRVSPYSTPFVNPNRRQLVSEAAIAAALLAAAAALNLLHFALFRDLHHLLLWGLTSLAFLPLSALVVTLFIERLLAARTNPFDPEASAVVR